ncbi:MAG: Signal recognition particle receptor FtsY [Sporanaerobacter sp.]|jgi:fused signal recognition particle receptor|uniref:signal recognition particle-docking protein FtsY n=1 Tax=Sporanaerobacter sp. TaxID=2010183 RepID=UPI003A10255D
MAKFFDIFKKKKKENIDEENIDEIIDEEINEEAVYEEIDVVKDEIVENEEIEKARDSVIQEDDLMEQEDLEEKVDFFTKLKQGLAKTRKGMTDKIDNILKSYGKIDEELFDELEEILITSDVGVETTMEIIDNLKSKVKENKIKDPTDVKKYLKEEIKCTLNKLDVDRNLNIEPSPAIILVVGVNGVGKTTTIGKMACNLRKDGKKVLIAAGDTFRAAAIEQLEEWANRANVDIVAHSEGSDPAAVIYDGIQAAKARKCDVLICDTAGRLHNKKNLMNELNKIFRVVEKEYPEATKEVLLVVDATTGQNAILQAKVFKEVCDITGIVLTKLDGTAKGGVVIALQSELNVPVKLVGVGEGIDDLQNFETESFVEAII